MRKNFDFRPFLSSFSTRLALSLAQKSRNSGFSSKIDRLSRETAEVLRRNGGFSLQMREFLEEFAEKLAKNPKKAAISQEFRAIAESFLEELAKTQVFSSRDAENRYFSKKIAVFP